MVLVSQYLHTLLKVGGKEALSDVEALELLDSVELLLSLVPSILKRLILLLYPLYFSLHFLLPLGFLSLAPLVIAVLVFPYLVQFMLLLNLKRCLLNRLV